jgi:hypothetical protein
MITQTDAGSPKIKIVFHHEAIPPENLDNCILSGFSFLSLPHYHRMITLRKLAFQSVLSFGYYRGETVASLMDRNKSYLIWAYYNLSNISFTEEVLEALNLIPKWRIVKPGTNPKMHMPFCTANNIFIDHELLVCISQQKQSASIERDKAFNLSQFKPIALRRRNQGHKTWKPNP